MVFSLALLAFMLVGPLICFLQCYLYTWHFRPFYWPTDMYEKVLYLAHVYSMRGRKEPVAGPDDMPVSGLLPPAELPKAKGYRIIYIADVICHILSLKEKMLSCSVFT